ncbi:MAG TPA: glycosyltransferase [bacterium]|nr:glycosyltransferase [bacterium]
MKIAQVVCVYPPYGGGIGKVAEMQSRGLTKIGETVEVFTPDFGRVKITDEKFKINYLKPVIKYGNSAFLPQLLWRLKSFDVIILHYPFFGTLEVLWFMKKIGFWNGKVFVYYHMDFISKNLFFKVFSLPSRMILKSFLKTAVKVMVQSLDYTIHSTLGKFYLAHKDKFVEIALGADLKPVIYKEQQMTNENFILFVGGMDRAHYFKGVDILLNAFSQLVLQHQKIKLFLVGDGDLRTEYEKLAMYLGLTEKVKFFGRVNDVEKEWLYSECKFLVLPSINSGEAFGMVLVEAMKYSKAVIATNLPGVRMVCKDKINGFLAQPGDVKDLAEKMKILLEDKDLCDKFGEIGRKMVEDKFNWKIHTEKLREIIYV